LASSAPSLISPENNSTMLTATPTFVWSAVVDELSGIFLYEIQVDDKPDFSSLEWSSNPVANSTTSSALLNGTYYWRVRAVDNAGNLGDWSVVWNFTIITENQPPVIETYYPAFDPTINETESITFNVVASDINEDDLTYAWYVNGELTGETGTAYTFVSNYDSAGTYVVNVTVSDGVYYDYHKWTLTVINVNRPPIIKPIGDQTAYEGQLFTLQVNASDPDNDTIMFSDNTTLFDINQTTGLISFTPNYDSAGTYWVNITATDGTDVVQQIFKLTIINTNRAPVIGSYSPNVYSFINETENQTFTVVAYDPDDNSIGYKWYLNNVVVAGETNSSYTFISTEEGVYNVTVIIIDNGTPKLSVNHSWTLWVSNVNVPPVADFVYYEGIQVADNDTVNVTLRVSGTKYKTVNMTISNDNGVLGNVSITREPGCPDTKTISIIMDSSQTYIIVLDYTAEEKGANPVWLTVEYRNISNKNQTHLVFNANKNETQTRMFNLTELLDMMIRGVCLMRFESVSYDPDGNIAGYEWEFDDGTASTDMFVYHYYTTGAHTVSLTVTDNEDASDTVYKNITVLSAVEYYSSFRGMVVVTLDCPADLLITDKYGSKIGFKNGEVVNFVPNATVIVCGDVEIYILPRSAEYDYMVTGAGSGEYKFTVFSPGEFGPGEFGPGEFGPGEYSPGEFSPGEFTGKTYCFESNTSTVTVDSFSISMDAGILNITSNEDKFYSLYIVNATQTFVASDMSISSGSLQSYTVTDWSKIGSTTENAVSLSVDDDKDGIPDFTIQLTSDSNGGDIIRTKSRIINGNPVFVRYTGPATLNIKPSTGTVPDNLIGIGVFVEVTGASKNILITIQYTPEQLKNAGVKASDLHMYYWNETQGNWILIPESGVWENNNTVWTKVDHLTIFTPMAEKKVAGEEGINWLLYTGVGITAVIIIIAVSLVIVKKKKGAMK
ncbi:MAG: PKD domain-containing protein, partial [Thermoplasmatales archaeon]|nr:PKD domain-containing protein [Thermoplasmatales archaeon]